LQIKVRCKWAENGSPIDVEYHDNEWAVPVHDDKKLYEFLLLESAQAGLSWSIVLKKREGYRRAFDNFDYQKIANYDTAKLEQLYADSYIIRNKLKIKSAVINARELIKIQKEIGSFDAYLWSFVRGSPKQNHWKTWADVPSRTEISDVMSIDLKKRGFIFVGSTICYSLMQAVGLVNDHTLCCYRYKELLASK